MGQLLTRALEEPAMAIRPKHVLVAVGTMFVIIGHLGDGTVTREAVFWLGVLLSLLGLVLELRP